MRDLRLVGVHEDGQHLLLADAEGERFRIQLDDPLRAAVRRDRPRFGQLQIEIDGGMRPREVQALIRAGLSTEEVSERSGWTVEKVARYEGPILAEREYVAGLARGVRLRGRGGGGASAPTLSGRVSQRLSGRGVDPAVADWDSARDENGGWTVVLTFPAGGRERQARWAFDVQARTVSAVDDEARWLSEDDTNGDASPVPAPHLVTTPARATTVYDVEAEGGVASPRPSTRKKGAAATPEPQGEQPLDLMSAMRERAAHRGRPRRRKNSPAQTPVDTAPREDALPLEDLAYDPEVHGEPPSAKGTHPQDQPDASTDTQTESAAETEAASTAESAIGDDVLPGDETAPEAEVERASTDTTDADDTKVADAADREVAEDDPADDEPVAKPARRRSGRPGVPSWDDVMFGAKPRD